MDRTSPTPKAIALLSRDRLAWLLLAACACSLTGCLGGGIYSVRNGEYGPETELYPNEHYEEGMPCHAGGSCGVSLFDAALATCGPPELQHEEYMYSDPGAMIAPTPKYHPLPTGPVFRPMYHPPLANIHQSPTPSMPPGASDKQATNARWRGPLPRMPVWQARSAPRSQVAYNPTKDIEFPRLPGKYLEPDRLAPKGANPIRPEASQLR